MNADVIQNWLVASSLAVTTIVTIVIQIRTTQNNQKEFLDKQLIELQRISFYDPFLEDENFTNQWNQMKVNYKSGSLEQRDKEKFLKYDVYTEMLFNFIERSFSIYKNEKNLLNYVDFKSWVRTHQQCWKNPLQEHSNREVYGKDMYYMVEDWLR